MSAEALRASITGEGTLLRIELRLAGDDPRIGAPRALPEDLELEAVVAKLARIDRDPIPWTEPTSTDCRSAAIVSRVLAPQVDADVPPFKRRVRQLKELGLTESLEIGYRLSPRGRAVLASVSRDPR